MTKILALCFALLFSAATHAADTITAAFTASDTSGTAPHCVFVSAIATTGTAYDEINRFAFHEILYTWDFGDPTSGTWPYGARANEHSKNRATGPVSAHCYETAGTYTITLRARAGAVVAAPVTATITVVSANSAFSEANTFCYYQITPFGSCPDGGSETQNADLDSALSACVGDNRRCLFNGGETFTADAATSAPYSNLMISSYGTGKANWVRTAAALSRIIRFGDTTDPTNTDVWLLNLNVDCSDGAGSAVMDILASMSRYTQMGIDSANCGYNTMMDITLLNNLNQTHSATMRVAGVATDTVLAVTGDNSGVTPGQTISIAQNPGNQTRITTTVVSKAGNSEGTSTITITDPLTGPASIGNAIRVWTPTATPTHPLWDQVFLIGNTTSGLDGSDEGEGRNSVFAAGKRLAVMGNHYDNQLEGEHGVRTMFTQQGVYAHNLIEGIPRAPFSVRSSEFDGEPYLPAGSYSEYGLFAFNKSDGASCLGSGSNNADGTGRARHWIFEKNYCLPDQPIGSNYISFGDGYGVSIRNNILDLSANHWTGGAVGIGVFSSSAHTVDPSHAWVYNNTIYRSTETGPTSTVTISEANPGVVTYAEPAGADDQYSSAAGPVRFTTTGALPNNLSVGTYYYIINLNTTANTFQLSLTEGGAAIDTSGSAQSGVHTVLLPMNSRPITLGFAGSSGTKMFAYNNLAYTPNVDQDSRAYNVTDSTVDGLTESNNTPQEPAVCGTKDSPQFASATPANPIDFAISADSCAANAGTQKSPATDDFGDFFDCHDKTGAVRMGAIVPRANAICTGRPAVQ